MSYSFLDEIDTIIARPSGEVRQSTNPVAKTVYTETCPACNGRGLWKGIRPCFKCKSKGTLVYKTAYAERVKLREKSAVKRTNNRRDNLTDFAAAQPAVVAWCQANTSFGFAKSLLDQIIRKGELSVNQIGAVNKILAKNAERNAARVVVKTEAATHDLSKITAAFDAAHKSGLKRMALRFDSLVLKAAQTAHNAGAIWVTDGGVYAGKIVAGCWLPSRAATSSTTSKLVEFAKDPHAHAISYGRRTGNCCCCGKGLIVKRSVELGIGPICEAKWGW